MVGTLCTKLQSLQCMITREESFMKYRQRRNLRVIYEYEADLPVVVTVYNPVSERYFQGRGTYEDRRLS